MAEVGASISVCIQQVQYAGRKTKLLIQYGDASKEREWVFRGFEAVQHLKEASS
jgi:hypothetical protein